MRRASALVRGEWRVVAREGLLRWCVAAALLMMAFATYNGWRWREFQHATVAQLEQEETARWARHLQDIDRHHAGTLDPSYGAPDDPYTVYAFTPRPATWAPAPLGFLSVGQSDLHAYYGLFSGAVPNRLFHDAEIQNPLVLALGRFDLAFFLVVILPLLVIALTFDLRSRESEEGRAGLLALSAGSLARLMLLRAAVRVGLLAMVVLAALALAALAALGANPAALRGSVGQLAGVGGGVVLYLAFWGALAYAVNGVSAGSVRNAIVLLAAWAALVLLWPAAADAGARRVHPLLSGLLRPMEERLALQAIDQRSAYDAFLRANPEFPYRAEEERPFSMRWGAYIEQLREETGRRRAEERHIVRERQHTADRAALVSPPLALQTVLLRAAAADSYAVLAFADAYDRFVAEWTRRARRNVFEDRPFSREEMEVLPLFDAAAIDLGQRPGGAPGIAAMGILTLLLSLLGFRAYRRLG